MLILIVCFLGVLVTGASGFVATHCVEQLLDQGYSVRGTVRSLKNEAKVQPLRELKHANERLELVEADLLDESYKWIELVLITSLRIIQ
jgi:nucleoside-diphosphate-sugar epimerase